MDLEFAKEIMKKDNINTGKIREVRDAIQRVLSHYDTLKKKNETEQKDELFKQEDEDIKEYNSIIDSIGGLQIQNSVAKHLLQNPQLMKSIFDRIINTNIEIEDRPFYTVDLDNSSELLLKQVIKDIRKSTKIEITLQTIKGVLENFINISNKDLKSKYIQLLNNSFRFLNRYDFIESYVQRNNLNMQRVQLEGLKIEDRDEISEEFENENLEKKSIEELLLLNVFYQNRLTKEKRKIYDAIFYIEELDLWNNTESLENVDDEALKELILKKGIIDKINARYKRRSDAAQHIETIKRNIKDYETYFGKRLPHSKNDLADDCMQTLYWNLHSRKIYDTKLDITYKVFESLMSKTKINWGYIPYEQRREENKEFLLLGIDYPGYNMPMTVHMKKETLIAFLSGMQASTIPVYTGHEDIFIGRNIVPTNILYKLPESKKEFVKGIANSLKKNPNAHPYPNIVHHINSIAKGINPYNHKQKGRTYVDVRKLEGEQPEGRE